LERYSYPERRSVGEIETSCDITTDSYRGQVIEMIKLSSSRYGNPLIFIPTVVSPAYSHSIVEGPYPDTKAGIGIHSFIRILYPKDKAGSSIIPDHCQIGFDLIVACPRRPGNELGSTLIRVIPHDAMSKFPGAAICLP
jgi:hypothetical protein